MVIKEIKLKNWKQFEGEHSFRLGKINFIQGNNGIGKTNLSLNAILFALYGHTGKLKQSETPSYGHKSCKVTLFLEKNSCHYTVIREIPSKLTILQNHTEIEWKEDGIKEKDLYIKNIFGDLQYFKQFRIIDGYDKEINFLEQGNTTLKKILSIVNDEVLNEIRTELLNQKNIIETTLSVQRLSTVPNYASEKRIELIDKLINKIQENIKDFDDEINVLSKELKDLISKKGILLSLINENKKQIEKSKREICYACKQPIPKERRIKIYNKAKKEIEKYTKEYKNIASEIEELESIIFDLKKDREELIKRKTKLISKKDLLKRKLKETKTNYTEIDLDIVKRSIKKYDEFVSQYLVYSIKTLEPLINSVLEKIGFSVEFVAKKNKFDLILTDGKGRQWNYNHLSTGQKLLLQIAVKSALLLQNNDYGVILADEGLGSLDEENLSYVIDLFNNLPFQLIMVLHHFKEIPEYVNCIDLNTYFGV